MANKKFTTIPHNFTLSFDERTVMKEVRDYNAGNFQGAGFNFKTIKQIEETVGLFMLDLIAVVTELQPVSQIQIKQTGEMRNRRSLTLSDDSGVSISATVWGDQSLRGDLEVGAVLAIKGAKVSDYGGKSLNL
jgi:replication factor A1